ncbi:hypothetical protein DJ73_18870, partial [Halorubrum sp. Ea1]
TECSWRTPCIVWNDTLIACTNRSELHNRIRPAMTTARRRSASSPTIESNEAASAPASIPATAPKRPTAGPSHPAAERATVWTFRGDCRLEEDGTGGDREVPIEALLAVWAADEYLLAGGAYPVVADAYPEGRGPEDARRELLGIVRGVRPPADNGDEEDGE